MNKLFLSLFLLICTSCVNTQSSKENQESATICQDSIEYQIYFEGDKKVEEYKDSIKVYYPNGQLSSISYFSKEALSEGMVLNKSFYKSGNLFSIEIIKDTTFLIDGEKLNGYGLYEIYFENGKLRYRGYKGDSGYNVGLWIYYDSLGTKEEERFCFPFIEDKNKAYTKIKEFHPNGSIKKEWQHYYFDEGEIPIGVTRYYNEQGKLIKTEKHK